MKYKIDQSGKIEDTSKPTVIAFSNDTNGSLIIMAKDKREIQNAYRQLEKPKMFTIQVFSALLYLLLERHNIDSMITIDIEYKGQEPLIKSYIIQLAKARNKILLNPEEINFFQVGKKCNAHKLAIKTFRNKKADYVVKPGDIFALVMLYDK